MEIIFTNEEVKEAIKDYLIKLGLTEETTKIRYYYGSLSAREPIIPDGIKVFYEK